MQVVKCLKFYSQQVCVWHTFKGHLLADSVHMKASWDVSRCRQSLHVVQSKTHIASSRFWDQRNLTAQKSCALLLFCGREGHSLPLKGLFLASSGATAGSAESHIQPSSSWTSSIAKFWWCKGGVGVKQKRRTKQGHLSMLPLQFTLLVFFWQGT